MLSSKPPALNQAFQSCSPAPPSKPQQRAAFVAERPSSLLAQPPLADFHHLKPCQTLERKTCIRALPAAHVPSVPDLNNTTPTSFLPGSALTATGIFPTHNADTFPGTTAPIQAAHPTLIQPPGQSTVRRQHLNAAPLPAVAQHIADSHSPHTPLSSANTHDVELPVNAQHKVNPAPNFHPNPNVLSLIRAALGSETLALLLKNRSSILLLDRPTLIRNLKALSSTGLQPAELATLVVRQPSILAWGWPALHDAIQKIRSCLELPASYTDRAILLRCSHILPNSAEQLNFRLNNLQSIFQLNRAEALRMATKQPMVLRYSSSRLLHQCQRLAAIGLSRTFIANAAALSPGVLTLSPENILAKADHLANAFQVERKDILPMLARSPAVLGASVHTLAAHAAALEQLMERPLPQLFKSVAACPMLLVVAPNSISRKVPVLMKLLGVSRSRVLEMIVQQPGLMTCRPESMVAKVDAMASMLQCSLEEVQYILVKMPSLMTQSSVTLADKAAALSAALQLAPGDLPLLVRHCPSLLGNKPETHTSKLQLLSEMLSLPLPTVIQMVRKQPRILSTRPERVASRWHLLNAMAACLPSWSAQLSGLALSSRCSFALASETKFARLHFLLTAWQPPAPPEALAPVPQADPQGAPAACPAEQLPLRRWSRRRLLPQEEEELPQLAAAASGGLPSGSHRHMHEQPPPQQQQQRASQQRLTGAGSVAMRQRAAVLLSGGLPNSDQLPVSMSTALAVPLKTFEVKCPGFGAWIEANSRDVMGCQLYWHYLGPGSSDMDWAYGPTWGLESGGT